MHVGDDILAVDQDALASRGPQGDVEDGSILRDVDLVAAEHRVDLVAEVGLLDRSATKQLHRLGGHPVLGVVEERAHGLDVSRSPRGIVGEQLPEVVRRHAWCCSASLAQALGSGSREAPATYAFFSSCPPNCLRIADRTRLAKSSRLREANRE